MSVIAVSRSARAVPSEGLLRLLRRNEECLFIVGLCALVVAMASLAVARDFAAGTGEIGACHLRGHSLASYTFLTMH